VGGGIASFDRLRRRCWEGIKPKEEWRLWCRVLKGFVSISFIFCFISPIYALLANIKNISDALNAV
jgi:hypothetical protein